MDGTPKTIILDMHLEYAGFKEKVTPIIAGTEIDAAGIVVDLFNAMYDQDDVAESLHQAVSDAQKYNGVGEIIARSPELEMPLAYAVHGMADALHISVDLHQLWGDRGYLPYDITVKDNGLLVLTFDEVREKMELERIEMDAKLNSEDDDEDLTEEDEAALREVEAANQEELIKEALEHTF